MFATTLLDEFKTLILKGANFMKKLQQGCTSLKVILTHPKIYFLLVH